MNHHEQSWQRLATSARAAADGRSEAAPYGFATRIVALAQTVPVPGMRVLFERYAVRGLIAALTFSLAAVAFGYSAWTGERDDEVAATDTVGQILDAS